MPATKAVIFDFFGTLVPSLSLTEHKAVLGEMAEIVGTSPDAFVQQWLATFESRVTGRYSSTHAGIEAICAALGIATDTALCERAVAVRNAYVRRHTQPRVSAVPTLRKIRARGLKIGLITDCSNELPELWSETVFFEWFDVAVFSCVAKVKKPNAEIYQRAAAELGVRCSECLYVGDGGSNELTGAKAVGMFPVLLFVPEEQGNADTHRVDGQAWDGARIEDLSGVLDLISAMSESSR